MNGQTAGSIANLAKAKSVPVVSYDRLIQNADIDYYVSFDNEKVGQLQAQSLVNKLKADGKFGIALGTKDKWAGGDTWFAQLAVKVGPSAAVEVARRMGITNIPPRGSKAYAGWNVCSLVLGAREVSVLDMAGAFGVLANKGVRCTPYSITKVVAPGERKPLGRSARAR